MIIVIIITTITTITLRQAHRRRRLGRALAVARPGEASERLGRVLYVYVCIYIYIGREREM